MTAGAGGANRVRTTTLRVPRMDCAVEEREVRTALRPLAAVHALRFRLAERTVAVRHEGDAAPVLEALAAAGFAAQIVGADAPRSAGRRLRAGAVAGLVLAAAGAAAEAAAVPRPAVFALFAAAVLAAGLPMIRKGLAAAAARRLDMNALMTIAVLGALAIGEWTEAAVVALLFALAESLEAASVDRARGAIRDLLDLAPPTARRRRGGALEVVPAEAVEPGETVVVLPGDRVPVDGEVVEGRSHVDQAAITGESMPVGKGPGDAVFAGSVNGEAALEVRSTRAADDTTLARVIELVERAEAERAPSHRLVDSFARRYTPAVIAGAVLMAVVPPLALGLPWGEAVYRALALLVIACPCALVLSTPVTIVSALAAAARHGVLVKGGAHVEALGRPDVVVLDKTGTLTRGRPALADVVPAAGRDGREVLALAAALEARSEHPLARAVVEAAEARGVAVAPAEAVEALRGRGVAGRVGGRRLVLASHRETDEAGICPPDLHDRADSLAAEGKTVALLREDGATPGAVLGVLAFADEVRPEARTAVEDLRAAGVREIRMLTGDNERTARAVAEALALDSFRAECLPDRKAREVRALVEAGRRVVFVGDGVNDAPAIATATVGVAMGAAGSPAALETAHAALMGDDLRLLPWAVRLGARARRVIAANVALSIGVKALFVGLSLAGRATLWGAIAADTGAGLVVIANGLRLLRSAPPDGG